MFFIIERMLKLIMETKSKKRGKQKPKMAIVLSMLPCPHVAITEVMHLEHSQLLVW